MPGQPAYYGLHMPKPPFDMENAGYCYNVTNRQDRTDICSCVLCVVAYIQRK
jgi:hypothetical protein